MQVHCLFPEGKSIHKPGFSPKWRTDIRVSKRRHSNPCAYQCEDLATVKNCGEQPNVTVNAAYASQADIAVCHSKNTLSAAHLEAVACQFYQELRIDTTFYAPLVWSKGKIRLLDKLMSENHEQHDMVWQPRRAGTGTDGRKRMKRGILAYRAAYPDLQFDVLLCCAVPTVSHNSHHISPHNSPVMFPDSQTCGDLPSEDKWPDSDKVQGAGSVLVHWQASGTNLGPIRDAPPSGKRVQFSGISRLDFDLQGRIIRSLVFRQATEDEASYFMSAGITPWTQTALPTAA